MKKIILASASPRRAELLSQIGLKFEIRPSDADETIDEDLSPEENVMGLAHKKALETAKRLKREGSTNAIVIGADTIVVKDRILGKPSGEKEAFSMLQSLRGQWHNVLTGVCLVNTETLKAENFFENTRVKMIEYTDEDILRYVETKEPLDKAGAYGIQSLGSILVEKIEGCYFNVVGLPLSRLSAALKIFGIEVLDRNELIGK